MVAIIFTEFYLFPCDKYFYFFSASSVDVEGIELRERTIIVQPKVRKVFYGMFSEKKSTTAMPTKPAQLSQECIKTAKKKMKTLLVDEYEGENELYRLLEYISNLPEKTVPQCYLDILYEVSKNTPIVGLIQSNSRTFQAALKSYLDGAVNIFEDKDMLDHLNEEVPVIVDMIAAVKKYENEPFLPKVVKDLFNFMLKLFSKVQKLASERFVKPEDFTELEPPTEYFASLPLHSKNKNYKVDRKDFKDSETVDDECNKEHLLKTHKYSQKS